MKALKVTSSDALCVEAAFKHANDEYGFVVVPDIFAHASSVEVVHCKHGSDFVRLEFPDGSIENIVRFEDDNPEIALKEARESIEYDGESNLENLDYWRNIYD